MSTYKIPNADGAFGHNDTIDNGRIGSGAFTVEIDLSKVNGGAGVAKNDYVQLCKLPGCLKVRQTVVTVAKPVSLVTNVGAPVALGAFSVIPYPYANDGEGTTLGTSTVAAANNYQGYAAVPAAVAVGVADTNAGAAVVNDLRVKFSAVTDGEAAETSKIVSGILLLTVYADFYFAAGDVKNMYPTDQAIMAPDGL